MSKLEVPEGAKVKVAHFRVLAGSVLNLGYQGATVAAALVRRANAISAVDEKGGRTEVTLCVEGYEPIVEYAFCRPDENFCRKLGREIALGRALKIFYSIQQSALV